MSKLSNIIILIIFCSCFQNKLQVLSYNKDQLSGNEIKTIENEIDNDELVFATIELDSSKVEPYYGRVQNLFHHKRPNLEYFIKTILVSEKGIQSIEKKDSTIAINTIQSDSVNYFEEASFLNYSWKYYYYHDIYNSFFSYPQINKVIVKSEGENITYLPASGNFDPIKLPNGEMPKQWYFQNIDYSDYINVEDESQFEDYSTGIVSKEYMKKIIKEKLLPTKRSRQ